MNSFLLLQDQVWDFLDHSQTQDTNNQFSSIVAYQQHVVTTHHIFFHLHVMSCQVLCILIFGKKMFESWYDWKISQYFCRRALFHVIFITVIMFYFVSWYPYLGNLCNPSNTFLYNIQSLNKHVFFSTPYSSDTISSLPYSD